MRKFTSFLYSILCLTLAISSVTFVVPSAQAVSIGSGNCASNSSTSSAVVALSGANCYVAVYATGANTWTPPAGVTTVDFVLIAGGGAGGAGAWGGGGGAGELVHRTSYSVTPGVDLSFSIGSGGTSGTAVLTPDANTRSKDGGNSWVGSASGVVANGGGAGASYAYGFGASFATGYDGGSGGGGTEDVSVRNGGASTASSSTNRVGYGRNGGKGGPGGSTQSGGGGGGAGGVGGDASAQTGGNGGSGTNAFSVWLSAINSGMSVVAGWQTATSTGFISGGGGGGTNNNAGSGGAGGGGNGASNTTILNGGDATSNTGSGGGGAGYGSSPRNGGAGGSGLLIIRYVADLTAPTITGPASATGANSTISVAEGATSVHAFTANETVSWSKSGTDSSFFSITSAGGVLTITARDFESAADNGANNTYVVTITATDSASNTTSQTLTVTITNVNEAPTISTASSNPTHTISQAENITSVVTYTGSDIDAGTTLAWSISGTDAADFSIDSSSGALSFATNPDFEGPVDSDANNSYIVTVTLSDGSLTDTQTVTITIANTNETASVNAPTVSGTIYKGVNTTITVTINVAGKVRFFVGGKRISTCKERTTSGSYPNNSATCTWKPAVTGRQYLTATLTPTDNTFSSSTSARTEVFVLKRTNSR